MDREGGPSEKDMGLKPEETRILSDAELIKGGARKERVKDQETGEEKAGERLEVTGEQVELARAKMEYEQNPQVQEFRDELKSFEDNELKVIENFFERMKQTLGTTEFEKAYDVASTEVTHEPLAPAEFNKVQRLFNEVRSSVVKQWVDSSKWYLKSIDDPPFVKDDIAKFERVRERYEELKREIEKMGRGAT